MRKDKWDWECDKRGEERITGGKERKRGHKEVKKGERI